MADFYYIVDPEIAQQAAQDLANRLKTNTGREDFVAYASSVIAERLLQSPEKYLEFGVYWWNLKQVLQRQGHYFGNNTHDELLNIYHHDTDAAIIAVAEDFKNQYRATFFRGNRDFDLNEDRRYSLFDEDMEMLILGNDQY